MEELLYRNRIFSNFINKLNNILNKLRQQNVSGNSSDRSYHHKSRVIIIPTRTALPRSMKINQTSRIKSLTQASLSADIHHIASKD